MDFADVLRRRRMVRHFTTEPVDPAAADRIIDAGLRAPSAGYSQGFALLVLNDESARRRFWDTLPEAPGGSAGWAPEVRAGVMNAPLLVAALSCKRAYLDRYAQPDKGWTDRDESRWPVPYWDVDTGMVALLILLAAVDEGLGAILFGLPPVAIPGFRAAFGVPDDHVPVGVVAIGHPDPSAPKRDLSARRRPRSEQVHFGSWRQGEPEAG
jgi:nitroreductase